MILRIKERISRYLDCTPDEALAFIEAGLPMVEPVAGLGHLTTDRLVDEWIENLYREKKSPAKRPVTTISYASSR